MKTRRGLFLGIFGLAFGLSLFSTFSKNSVAKETNAIYSANTDIFIRNNGGQYNGWLKDGAKLKIEFKDGLGNEHSDFLTSVVPIANSDSYIYKYTFETDAYSDLKISRYNSEGNSCWNTTNSVSLNNPSKNLLEIDTNISSGTGLSFASANINHLMTADGKNGTVKIVVYNTDNDIGSDAYVYSDHWFQLVGVPNPGFYLTEFYSNNDGNLSIKENGRANIEGTTNNTTYSGIFLQERGITINDNEVNSQFNTETKEVVAMNVFIEKGQCIKGTYRGGAYNVFVEDHDRDFICNNGDEAICQFTGFYNIYLKSNDGGNNYPNIYIASQDKIDVERFINEALLMNSYDTSRSGSGDGRCKIYYTYAISAYNNQMTEYSIYLFENRPEYEEARQRFAAWRQLNTTGPNSLAYNGSKLFNEESEDDSVVLLTVISGFASSALLGVYILKRKKHI